MRKKVLSLALALALCLGLAVPAFAAESPKIIWLPEGICPMLNMEIETIDPFRNGLLVVYSGTFTHAWKDWNEVKYGLMDKTGKLVVPVEYDGIGIETDGSVTASKGDTTYFIGQNGQVLGTTTYNIQGSPAGGLYLVNDWSWPDRTDNCKYGFVDQTGRPVIPLDYDKASGFSEGLAAVCKNNKWGFVDQTGAAAVPLSYDYVSDFKDGLAVVRKNSSWSFIDRTGTAVLSLGSTYQSVEPFTEGLAVVRGRNDKSGAIDQSGKLVVPLEYDVVGPFSEGLSWVSKVSGRNQYGDPTYKCGFIDTTGAVVIPLGNDLLYDFSDGLALTGKVSGSDEYGPTYQYSLIDRTGAVVRSLDYDEVYPFENGQALVVKGDYGSEDQVRNVIDTSGKERIPAGYDFMWEYGKYGTPGTFFDGVAAVSKNGAWGYLGWDGRILLPLEYDEVGYASGGMGVVRQGSRYGIVDLNAPSAVPTGVTAMPTNDALTCDGLLQTPTVYKINNSNYFKIRDLAAILNGTGKQFDVGYDQAAQSVTAIPGEGYARLDTDLTGAPAGGNKAAQLSNDAVYINGVKVDAEVYKIDGSNYFKLRDLGKALDFYVGWSEQRGVYILTAQPYAE